MNTHQLTRTATVFLFLLASAAVLGGNLRTAEFQWVDSAGKYMDLRFGDRPVLRYIAAPLDESSEQSRYETYKVFHHLYDASGKVLLTNGPTGDSPYAKDVLYPHHRGLFYGYNRISYEGVPRADTWHCGKGESQQHVKTLAAGGNGEKGWHRVAIAWHGPDGNVFANEEREMTVSFDGDSTVVDFVSKLESATGGTIHLDGDPQHAGFQFRATDEVAKKTKEETYYLRTDGKGKPGETRNWDHKKIGAPQNDECADRPWNAMSFVVGGKRYTALYLDHPRNPKPARYSERDYGRFGSYFVHDLKPGEPLLVRYRLWLQEGEMTVETAKKRSREFVDSAKP